MRGLRFKKRHKKSVTKLAAIHTSQGGGGGGGGGGADIFIHT